MTPYVDTNSVSSAAELESLLAMKGETVPPSRLASVGRNVSLSSPSTEESLAALQAKRPSFGASSSDSSKRSPHSIQSAPPHIPLHSNNQNLAPLNATQCEIPPGSTLELALVQVVLPHTPYLTIPVHPQRFIASLSLPPSDPQRPHPALLYILFAEAARLLERGTPPPKPTLPTSLFPQVATPAIPPLQVDPAYVLPHVRGLSGALMERARSELEQGMRNVDRPLDLVRAGIGIVRYLYSLGRFVEGWCIPVTRLVIACGLHRIMGTIVPPQAGPSQGVLPPPYASAYQYIQTPYHPLEPNGLPALRMRPAILPPPRDEIDLAERVMTFWAAKSQDWSAAIDWTWTQGIADDECTTRWPWGSGGIEPMGADINSHHILKDLMDPMSEMQASPYPDTTYVLALKSLALLHRTSWLVRTQSNAAHHSLFDLAIASVPNPSTQLPRHVPPLEAIQEVEVAMACFRKRMPAIFQDLPRDPHMGEEIYDGASDPWWIMLHANMYTAEMLMYREMAHHQPQGYQSAVSCARALVNLAQRIRPDQWAGVGEY